MRHLFLLPLVLAFPLFGAFPDICERCWHEVPNSNLDAVAQTPKPPGWSYFRETMDYNGGAFDTRRNRLLVTLGGYTAYAGNEIYAFDVDSLKWFRIKNGSTYYDTDDTLFAYYKNGGAVPDSQQPRPGYTFDQIEYDSTSDNLHVFGVPFAYKNGTTWRNIHRLNLSTLNWSYGGDIGHDIYGGSVSARDPATGKIWFLGNGTTSWMSSYSPSTGVRMDHGDAWSGDGIASYQTGAIMPPKNRFISIGGGAANYWNLVTSGNTDRQTLATLGCDSLKAVHGPGFEWSKVDNKMVGWAGGTSVYTMDTTFTCSEVPASGSNTVTPESPERYGTFGRWRYIPKYNVFMVVNSPNGNVYFYRHSAYNPSTAKDTVVITSPASGFLTNQGSVPVAWTVNGVHQNTGLVEVLEEEGPNPIIRCAGSACDTVMVSRDTQAPVVVITQPKGGDTVLATKAIVHFTLDGAVQIPDTVAL
ncbi:MAG TPA: hypothetical protein VK465_16680, partial [Fibrobacteria bacterium]|nr:hypothetical protein [Fibrobacteria bacterium]